MNKIHAEIQYTQSDGIGKHSDICPPSCSSDNLADEEYRKLLHSCLDEWLDNSNGTGAFYIKEEKFDLHHLGSCAFPDTPFWRFYESNLPCVLSCDDYEAALLRYHRRIMFAMDNDD